MHAYCYFLFLICKTKYISISFIEAMRKGYIFAFIPIAFILNKVSTKQILSSSGSISSTFVSKRPDISSLTLVLARLPSLSNIKVFYLQRKLFRYLFWINVELFYYCSFMRDFFAFIDLSIFLPSIFRAGEVLFFSNYFLKATLASFSVFSTFPVFSYLKAL